ncbi:MAG: diguanylate cyclase [Alteromonadaceae bacterium]|nr:diguanylate cyclase [Alteromonadaceae bacterium]
MSIFDLENISLDPNNAKDKPWVMLVDDEVENLRVLRQLLEKDFRILTGENGYEAINMINNMPNPEKIQLIISDQRMPEFTGIEFLEKISKILPDTIRIILTGYSDVQVIIDSINKAKLYKFLTKPFDPVELSLTVRRGVEAYQMRRDLLKYSNNLEKMVSDKTTELTQKTKELKFKNEELVLALDSLERLSLSDQLTGAHNRHFLIKFFPQELSKFKRENNSLPDGDCHFGLIMVDIDYFKLVNDTYGHDAGDQVLKQFTDILHKTCRESDWVIRWGGEEFVIVARGLNFENLLNLAERIRANVEAYEFDLGCDQSINKTCSLGIASFPFIKNEFASLTWEQTLNIADLALYIAKNNGRNAWVSLQDNNIEEKDKFYNDVMTDLKKQVRNALVTVQISRQLEHELQL